jgi:hypothetical protein
MMDVGKSTSVQRIVDSLLARSRTKNGLYLAFSLAARVLNAAGMQAPLAK